MLVFQPTRPLRGATTDGRSAMGKRSLKISTHAPLAGRDELQIGCFRS